MEFDNEDRPTPTTPPEQLIQVVETDELVVKSKPITTQKDKHIMKKKESSPPPQPVKSKQLVQQKKKRPPTPPPVEEDEEDDFIDDDGADPSTYTNGESKWGREDEEDDEDGQNGGKTQFADDEADEDNECDEDTIQIPPTRQLRDRTPKYDPSFTEGKGNNFLEMYRFHLQFARGEHPNKCDYKKVVDKWKEKKKKEERNPTKDEEWVDLDPDPFSFDISFATFDERSFQNGMERAKKRIDFYYPTAKRITCKGFESYEKSLPPPPPPPKPPRKRKTPQPEKQQVKQQPPIKKKK